MKRLAVFACLQATVLLASCEQGTVLAQSATAPITYFQEHAALLRAALGPTSEKIERQIKQFSFTSARITVRALR